MSDIRKMAAYAGYFGIVMWEDGDLAEVLRLNKINPSQQNVDALRSMIDEDRICEHMIESGWDYIDDMLDKARREHLIA